MTSLNLVFLGQMGEKKNSQQTVEFGGGHVMMWVCVSCEGVGPLVRVELNGG